MRFHWTEHTFRCRWCRREARVSRGRLQLQLQLLAARREVPTVAAVLQHLRVCLSCARGEQCEGEHVR